jgi:hypothetical protein
MAISAKVNGKKLIIEIDLQDPSLSKTGRTLIVAKTEGPAKTEAKVNNKTVTVNLSAWIAKD